MSREEWPEKSVADRAGACESLKERNRDPEQEDHGTFAEHLCQVPDPVLGPVPGPGDSAESSGVTRGAGGLEARNLLRPPPLLASGRHAAPGVQPGPSQDGHTMTSGS